MWLQKQLRNCLFWHQPEAISMSDRVIVLSQRPATVKSIYEIDFEMENRTPLNCRENPKFSRYFNLMWRELEKYDKAANKDEEKKYIWR